MAKIKTLKYPVGKFEFPTTKVIAEILEEIDSKDYLRIKKIGPLISLKCQRGKGNYVGYNAISNEHILNLCGDAYSQKAHLISSINPETTKLNLVNLLD